MLEALERLERVLSGKTIKGIFPVGKEGEFGITFDDQVVEILKDEGSSASGIKIIVQFGTMSEIVHRIDFKY